MLTVHQLAPLHNVDAEAVVGVPFSARAPVSCRLRRLHPGR